PALQLHSPFRSLTSSYFFYHHLAPSYISTLSLHDALPIYFTYDEGRHWDYVDNLPIGQFYDVAVDAREPYWIYGGTQDNGTFARSEEHTSELQSLAYLVCRLLLEKKNRYDQVALAPVLSHL